MTSTAETWTDLVAVGLLGTERRPLPTELADAVGSMVGTPDALPLTGEVGVLAAAGVLSAYRRAGAAPSSSSAPPPPPADDDVRPFVAEPALRLLDLLLAGHVSVLGSPHELVGLWLKRCAASGFRLPPAHLVSVLQLATTRLELREAATDVAGPLGVWLAGQNPSWSWVGSAGSTTQFPDDADRARTLWETGTRDERLALLRSVRDHDPSAGLALIESTWAGEKAADRSSIIETVAATTSIIDEPFLEAALDDRAKTVRERAAATLQTIPGSRLAERAAARLIPLVSQPKGLLRKKIEVELPVELDQGAMTRDGFTDKGRPAAIGAKAWELAQLVGVAPLHTWTELLSLDPAGIVAAASGSDNFNALVYGWTRAVHQQRSADDRVAWALALLDLPEADASLLRLLPPELANREAAKRIKVCPEVQLHSLVNSAPGPWTVDLTRQVIERYASLKSLGPASLQHLAANAPPESIPDLQAWAARLSDDATAHLRAAVNKAISTISFRQSIIQELP